MLQRLLSLLAGKPHEPRSPKWRAVEKAHLAKFPECAACGTRKGVEVHHVVPVGWPGGREMELLESNLLSLCRVHHFWLGHWSDWRSRNPDVRLDAVKLLEKIRNRPYPAKEGTP